MKKKVLAMILGTMLVLSLAACGGSDDATEADATATEETADTEEATEDTEEATDETAAEDVEFAEGDDGPLWLSLIHIFMSSEGWEVSSQDKGHYLFMESRRQFALRPDIVMKRGGRTVILDTKWKSLVDNERVNYGISQADMYQMYAYSKKYNTPEIWLLYPVNDEMRNHSPIRFESGDGTTVNLHFVDVDKIEDSL